MDINEIVRFLEAIDAELVPYAGPGERMDLYLLGRSALIVRYGPSTDDHAMAALATRMEKPRCATAPEFGYPCPGRTLMARDVNTGKQPDL